MAETLAQDEVGKASAFKYCALYTLLTLVPRMNIFGDRVFRRWLRLNAVI